MPLTPKAFDVLRYLVEHADRVVTQDELLDAVWAETYVNPEGIRKYVLEFPFQRVPRIQIHSGSIQGQISVGIERHLHRRRHDSLLFVKIHRLDRLLTGTVPRLSTGLAGGTARHAVAVELDPDPVGAWDLSGLAASYAAWPRFAERLLTDEPAHADEDEKAFAARFRLVHEWRKFLFDDPGLPAQLLPDGWPGVRAAELFTREAARLKPAADRFVGRCLGTA